jgi:hypothetical protein
MSSEVDRWHSIQSSVLIVLFFSVKEEAQLLDENMNKICGEEEA